MEGRRRRWALPGDDGEPAGAELVLDVLAGPPFGPPPLGLEGPGRLPSLTAPTVENHLDVLNVREPSLPVVPEIGAIPRHDEEVCTNRSLRCWITTLA